MEILNQFEFGRVLKKDDVDGYIALLGKLPAKEELLPAIVRIQRTTDLPVNAESFLQDLLAKVDLVNRNDIYMWMNAWMVTERPLLPDLKIDVICPATETHIRKYTHQDYVMVQETPELFQKVTKPYIDSFDPKRTEWIQNIFDGKAEQSSVLHMSPNFLLLPDMKWTPSSPDNPSLDRLYLLAISRPSLGLRSLRDLRKEHIPMLQEIMSVAVRSARNFGLEGEGRLRMFVHYQPSYYYFHVHIVNSNYQGLAGMNVGQAHLLEDIISLLSTDGEIFAKLTLTYGLGEQHALLAKIREQSKAGQGVRLHE